jgi:hypothetical protein
MRKFELATQGGFASGGAIATHIQRYQGVIQASALQQQKSLPIVSMNENQHFCI